MEDGVRDAAKTAGGGRCGEVVAKVHSRAHSEASVFS
jgi:hypothetical protein